MNLKESRISFLVLLSLCLLLLAFIILFAWAFMYYRQAAETVKSQPVIVIKDSAAIANAVKDSLQKIYANTWQQLNQQLDAANSNADSLQGSINAKYQEFSQIKEEISLVLQTNKTASELEVAKMKLLNLQIRLDDWRKKYNDVAAENARLSALLKQLASTPVNPAHNNAVIASNLPEPNRNAEPVLTGMQVKALQLQAEEQNDKVKLKGSLEVVNNDNTSTIEMYVVILQPDGKLLKQSGWDSGSFETREGSKIYSCKLKFDCLKGESKSLSFSVPSAGFQKGTYRIQVYHKGIVVARSNKNLS